MASWSDVGAGEGSQGHHDGDGGANDYDNGGHGGDPWHDGDHGGDPWRGNNGGLPGGEGGRDGSSAAGWSWTNDGKGGSVGRREQDPDNGSQYLGSTSSRRRRGKRGSGGKQQQHNHGGDQDRSHFPRSSTVTWRRTLSAFGAIGGLCVDGCGSPKNFFLRTNKHFEL